MSKEHLEPFSNTEDDILSNESDDDNEDSSDTTDDKYFIPIPTAKLNDEDDAILLDDVLKNLGAIKLNSSITGEYSETVKCCHPDHPDNHPSLEVKLKVEDLQSSINLTCWPCIKAGRKMSDIYRLVGVDPTYKKSDSYIYRSGMGNPVAKKIVPRFFDSKTGEQDRKEKPYWLYPIEKTKVLSSGIPEIYHIYVGKKKWMELNPDKSLPAPELYQLDKIYLTGQNKGIIFIPEGEKDVETLRSKGYDATCEPHGSGSWRSEYARYLEDFILAVILLDNDSPGIRRKDKIARSILNVGKPVKCIKLDGPEKYDITDWFNDGHTQQEFDNLVKNSPLISLDDLEPENRLYGEIEIPSVEKNLLNELDEKYVYITQHGEGRLTQIVFNDISGFSVSTNTPSSLKGAYYAGYEVYRHYMKLNKKTDEVIDVVEAINIIDYWNEGNRYNHNHGAKVYSRINFDPRPNPELGIYNTWTGLKIDPIFDADISEYEQFLQFKICGGDIEAYNYFLDFFAQMFQQPHILPMVSLVLRGKPGSGKSGIIWLMRQILGLYSTVVDQWDKVTGQYNNHLANKLLIHIDDATWGGYKKDAGTLKNRITSDTIVIDGKYAPIITLNNYARYTITGNDQWTVDKDADDRRFFVIDVPPASDQQIYYKAFFEKWKQPKYLSMILGCLLKRDLSNWNPVDIVKKRTIGCDMGEFKRTQLERFIFDLVDSGSISYPSNLQLNVANNVNGLSVNTVKQSLTDKPWPERVNADVIHQSYTKWCSDKHLPIDIDKRVIFKKFYEILNIEKSKVNNPGTYNRSNSVTTIYLRSLSDTRESLVEKYKLNKDYFD